MRLILLLLTASAAMALDNSVIFRDRTGTGQSGVPRTMFFAAAPGEIPNYPRPAVTVYDNAGVVVTPRTLATHWQSDVMTRHRDGSQTLAITTVSNRLTQTCPSSGLCDPQMYVRVVTAAAHDVLDGEEIAISNSPVSEINGTWRVVDRTDTTMDLAGLNSVQFPGSTTGDVSAPANGSWATGMVTLFLDIPAGGWVRVDMVNSTDPSHAPQNQGLTRSQLAARSWDAETEVSMPVKSGHTGSFVINARSILNNGAVPNSDCGVRRWLKGPLVTMFIIEARCSYPGAYDAGWEPAAGVSTITETGLNTTDQSDGTMTLTLSAAPAIEASPGNPVVAYMGAGSARVREFLQVCGVSGTTITICAGGRGYYGTTIQSVADGSRIYFLQGANTAQSKWKHISPSFHVWSYTRPDGTPYPSTRIRFVLSNGMNSGAYAAGYFSFQFRTSGNTPRYRSGVEPQNTASMPAQLVWFNGGAETSKVYWDGADPEWYCAGGAGQDPCTSGTRAMRTRLEPNLEWLIHTGLLPQFTTGPLPENAIAGHMAQFDVSDRGDSAVPFSMYRRWTSGCSPLPASILVLGGANYGQFQTSPLCASMSTDDATRQEPFMFYSNVADMLFALGDDRGHELFLGTSVSGGGGLRAAEHHLNNVNFYEGDSTYGGGTFTTSNCPTCTSYGRVLSADQRYGVYVGSISASQTPLTRAVTDANHPQAWERPGIFVVGATTLDQAHRSYVAPYAYMLTGEYYDLKMVQQWAAWHLLYKNPAVSGTLGQPLPSAARRRSWAVQFYGRGHLREATWATQSLILANVLTPNVPQFDNIFQPPEGVYFRRQLVRTVRSYEGYLGLGDSGSFKPRSQSCSDIDYSTANSGVTVTTTNDIYCWSRMFTADGKSVGVFLSRGAQASDVPDGEPSKVQTIESPYMQYGLVAVFGYGVRNRLSFLNGLFHHSGKVISNMVRSVDFNHYLATYYRLPFQSDTTGYQFEGRLGTVNVPPNEGYQTLEAVRDVFKPYAQFPTTWQSATRYNYDNGYGQYLRAALSMLYGEGVADRSSHGCVERAGGCTAEGAFHVVSASLPNQSYEEHRRVSWKPPDRIDGLQIIPTGNGAITRFRNPSGAGGSYSVGTTPPASSLEDGETTIPPGGAFREIRISALAPNTTYHLRITSGTARTTASFTTGSTAGPIEVNRSLHPPAGCSTGCSVRVEHSDNGVAWDPLPLLGCSSGCTASIPATQGVWKYWRYRYYQDSGGTQSWGQPSGTLVLAP